MFRDKVAEPHSNRVQFMEILGATVQRKGLTAPVAPQQNRGGVQTH